MRDRDLCVLSWAWFSRHNKTNNGGLEARLVLALVATLRDRANG